jgi:large subunit ribosomal protein L5
MNRLQEQYQQTVVPQLQKEWSVKTPFAIPKITKIVVNVGVTKPVEPKARQQVLENVAEQIKIITGQKPKITTARKSIAGFKLRAGDPLGVTVTMRGTRMWEFLDKLVSITLPRVKDFQGVSRTAFDGRGNYSLGLEEQIVFPEVNYDTIDQVRGLQIVIVTNGTQNDQTFRLLELLGMPFKKEDNKG